MEKATNNQLDLSSVINASVEDQIKIQKAAEAAKAAFQATQKLNSAKMRAANQVVSTIQKQTAKALDDAKKAQEEAYKKTLCDLGLSAEAYPMETALLVADQKLAKPVLGLFGKLGKIAATAGNYVKEGVKAGYKS